MAHGRVLQPLLVRPRVPPLFQGDANATVGHEIVFGHCRYRAARLAGLVTVPCMVRAMDDLQVKRAQISENLQRKDVHPIEEAEGFQALIDEHNETADRIAEQTGKSRSYVYGRLKLLQACPKVRQACVEGKVGSEVALLIARLRTAKLQEKALHYISGKGYDLGDGGTRSFRNIKALLVEHFTLDLDKAPFPIEEEMLLPKAGNCVRCTKRSGNAPEFTDLAEAQKEYHYSTRVYGPNVCTDPDCFGEKKVVFFKREAEALRAKGKTVVDGNKARAAIDAYGKVKGAYMQLSEAKPQLKTLPAGVKIETITLQDPRNGKTVEAVKVADLAAHGVELKPKASSSGHAGNAAYDKGMAEEKVEVEAINTERLALLQKVRTTWRGAALGEFELRLVARQALYGIGHEEEDLLASLWAIEDVGQLRDTLADMTVEQLTQLLMDCALLEDVQIDRWSRNNKPLQLLAAAQHYGIDPSPTPPPAARALDAAPAKARKTATAALAHDAASTASTSAKLAQTAKQPGGAAALKVKVDAGVTAVDAPAQTSLLEEARA